MAIDNVARALAKKSSVKSGSDLMINTGTVVMPEIIKNNSTGELTIGTGVYRLCNTNDFYGLMNDYTIAGNTFTIPDDKKNHIIIADYNNGSPYLTIGTNADINDSNELGILTVAYNPLIGISVVEWGREAIGLVNKLNIKAYSTSDRFTIKSGFNVAVENTREIIVSSGEVYVGTDLQIKGEVHSGTDKCMLNTGDGSGSVTQSLITQYNSTVYDDGTGSLKTLSDGNYGCLWVWRSMSDILLIDVMYGKDDYNTESLAIESEMPDNVPVMLESNAMLLGKFVYQKGSDTATFISILSSGGVTGGGITSHFGLTDLEGGGDNYYHSDQPINKSDNVEFNSLKTTNVSTPVIKPPIDSTAALTITKADGTTVLFNFDTINKEFDLFGYITLNDGTNNRFEITDGTSRILSPDSTKYLYVNNTQLGLAYGGVSRFMASADVTEIRDELSSGYGSLKLDTNTFAYNDGTRERLKIDGSDAVLVSPDGTHKLSSRNSYNYTVGDFYPFANATYDLGSASYKFLDMYAMHDLNLIQNTNTAYNAVNFGDTENPEIGWVSYYHGTDTLRLGAGGSHVVYLNNGKVEILGYTKLGSSSPAVKQKYITSTLPAVDTNSTISTGIDVSKIVGISVLASNTGGTLVPPSYTGHGSTTDSLYNFLLEGTTCVLLTGSSATAVASQPVRLLITYTE